MAHDRARRLRRRARRVGVRKNCASKCALWWRLSSSSGVSPTRRAQRDMKRVSSEKKPCSRPSSARMSPSRSPTTNVLPSRTLRVRSDTRERPAAAWSRHGPVGALVGGGDDFDVAMLAHPVAAARAASIRGSMADRVGHRALVVDQEAGLPVDHELARGALRETRSPASRRRAPRPSPSRTAHPTGSASAARGHGRTASASTARRPRPRSGRDLPSMWGATSRSKNACCPGWMTPANTSGTSTARAAAIARCGPFSGSCARPRADSRPCAPAAARPAGRSGSGWRELPQRRAVPMRAGRG